MADVFISYSRKDQPFVRRLQAALTARDIDAWVDWEGIPATAEWMAEVHGAIEAADAMVFVLSPDSAQSEVCGRGLEHAATHSKRVVPLDSCGSTDQVLRLAATRSTRTLTAAERQWYLHAS